jgi:hypothetical protein
MVLVDEERNEALEGPLVLDWDIQAQPIAAGPALMPGEGQGIAARQHPPASSTDLVEWPGRRPEPGTSAIVAEIKPNCSRLRQELGEQATAPPGTFS